MAIRALLLAAAVARRSPQEGSCAPSLSTPQVIASPLKLSSSALHNNSALAGLRHFSVKPLASSMGAEVLGLNLSVPLGDAQLKEVKSALHRHGMLIFRDQRLTHAAQERFTAGFGEFAKDAYTGGVPGHPNVARLVKEADTEARIVFGEGWHTDSPFLPEPPSYSILYSKEVPPYGGDTMFASSRLAYQYLSDTMKGLLRGLRVRMSAARVLAHVNGGGGNGKLGDSDLSMEQGQMVRGSLHPIVRRHPITGEAALYVDHTYAVHIDGMTTTESDALLGFLRAHVTQETFTCRVRWEADMLIVWDNRLVLASMACCWS